MGFFLNYVQQFEKMNIKSTMKYSYSHKAQGTRLRQRVIGKGHHIADYNKN